MDELQAKLVDWGRESWSGPEWKKTIEDHIVSKVGYFDTVIEVGHAYGGFSARLALLASLHGFNLVLLDISDKMVEIAHQLFDALNWFGIKDRIMFYDKTFMTFAKERTDFQGRAIVIIDASHYFDNTIKDISAMYHLKQRPISVFLHDYSLRRYPDLQGLCYITAVDHAIKYVYGDDVKPTFVGRQFNSAKEGRFHPYESTKAYYVQDGYEGCLLYPLPEPMYVFGKSPEDYAALTEVKQ